MRPEKGVIFLKGHISLKLAQKTSIETRYKLFQRHVSFYILKISKGGFVWDAPPLLISPLLNNIPLNIFAAVGNRNRLVLKLVKNRIFSLYILKIFDTVQE
jgi:hypothetical protein